MKLVGLLFTSFHTSLPVHSASVQLADGLAWPSAVQMLSVPVSVQVLSYVLINFCFMLIALRCRMSKMSCSLVAVSNVAGFSLWRKQSLMAAEYSRSEVSSEYVL